MPGTSRYLGVTNRHDPVASIDGGARYLREMLDKFGQIHLALAAYNAGPGAVMRAGGIPRNNETPGYVRSVLGRWQAIRSEEHTSELQSLMRNSYAVFCLIKKHDINDTNRNANNV